MRILFTFIGGTGHFMPLLPLARAAERAGHTVAVAGAGGQVPVIDEAGFTAYPTSAPPSAGAARRRGSGPPEVTDARGAELEFAENFASRGASRHASVLPSILDDFRPDVVVRDEADLGSAVAAERCGLPTASILVLAAGTLIRAELVEPRMREVRVANGLLPTPPEDRHELVLSPFPPSLRAPGARPAVVDLVFRPGEPQSARDQASPPRVFVSLGTSFGRESGDLLDRLLQGLARVSSEVTVALGRQLDPEDLGLQPGHVRLERFVDQDAVLAGSDLVVHHGGSGTLLGAVTHGLPQVLLPLGADQPHNAERIATLGLGRVLDAAAVTAPEIAVAVEDVLADPAPRARARAVQGEINDLPDVDAALGLVVAEAGGY